MVNAQFLMNNDTWCAVPLTMRHELLSINHYSGAETQDRTGDTSIFSAVLYLLSYLGKKVGVAADL
jgi:hypothetical protein